MVFFPKTNVDFSGSGMAQNVGQGLLKDSEHGCGFILSQLIGLGVEDYTAGNAGSTLEILSLPLDGRSQTEIVQNDRSQLCTHPVQNLQGCINDGAHGIEFGLQRSVRAGQVLCKPGQIHFEHRQGLTKLVMQLAGNAGSFLFADFLKVVGQVSQLLTGLPDFFSGLLFDFVPLLLVEW